MTIAQKWRINELREAVRPLVHRGPDHWRGESDGTSKKTRSSKRGR